jgi:hypothetical protein
MESKGTLPCSQDVPIVNGIQRLITMFTRYFPLWMEPEGSQDFLTADVTWRIITIFTIRFHHEWNPKAHYHVHKMFPLRVEPEGLLWCSQDIAHSEWNLKDHYHAHKMFPTVHGNQQFIIVFTIYSPIHSRWISSSHFCHAAVISFYILPSHLSLDLPSELLSLICPKSFMHVSSLPCMSHAPLTTFLVWLS